jgi:nucleoside-diphosphate-sugar epimerase
MSSIRKILVTGDTGYIGSVLTTMLRDKSYDVCGFDTGYYEDCLLYSVNPSYPRTNCDIRDFRAEYLNDVDAVIHLAGLSNDPLGELVHGVTEEINLTATLKLAKAARAAGVKRFIYASSQSMYGVSNIESELDEDESEKKPITSYARTKWEAEQQLKMLMTKDFTVVCFRPSTVFGASPRLRCDIVFNNLVACAFTTGRIAIKSDGTPWRPVVHVRDVCDAFIAGIEAPLSLVGGRSYNVGIPNGNFTVRDLAEAAQRSVPGSSLVFTGEHGGDSRTYRVSFKRILTELHDFYKPSWDLDRGGKELVDLFRKVGFTEEQFRGKQTIRLAKLNDLIETQKLDENLRWKDA